MIFDRRSWEERQAEKLRKLKAVRVKEESRAKLRKIEDKELKRIEKAKSVGSGSGFLGRLGSGMEKVSRNAEKGSHALQNIDDRFADYNPGFGGFGASPIGSKHHRRPRKKQSYGFGF